MDRTVDKQKGLKILNQQMHSQGLGVESYVPGIAQKTLS